MGKVKKDRPMTVQEAGRRGGLARAANMSYQDLYDWAHKMVEARRRKRTLLEPQFRRAGEPSPDRKGKKGAPKGKGVARA